jgi:hypothetical protein
MEIKDEEHIDSLCRQIKELTPDQTKMVIATLEAMLKQME